MSRLCSYEYDEQSFCRQQAVPGNENLPWPHIWPRSDFEKVKKTSSSVSSSPS